MGVVTDLPRGETQEPPADAPDYVSGGPQLTFDVGGKSPTGSSLRLYGGKIETPAEDYAKGQLIEFRGVARVFKVGFQDAADDATGQVVSCEKAIGAKITELQVVGIVAADAEAA